MWQGVQERWGSEVFGRSEEPLVEETSDGHERQNRQVRGHTERARYKQERSSIAKQY